MRILIGITFCLFITTLSFAQQKQVCITIDDMPLVTYGISDTVYQKSMMDKLIAALKANAIPAMGFVNEIKLYNNDQLIPFQVQLLKNWLAVGLDLGNHTYSHPDYNLLSPTDFFKEIIKGEQVTSKLLAANNKKITYFRHPFLHVGNTKSKSDSLSQFLADHNYIAAPVTIDNEDYLFAVAYKRAQDKHDTKLIKQIGSDYITYMEQKLLYFERQSHALFGRPIKQILLLHANALNADYLPALATMLLKNNYEIISLPKALEDEAYQTPITVYGKWGISWIDRWALSQGKKGDFFKGDPETPAYIIK
jgi:peptidoglycan/xylan/chitin deacetylase (PgdA/CDA1 family)